MSLDYIGKSTLLDLLVKLAFLHLKDILLDLALPLGDQLLISVENTFELLQGITVLDLVVDLLLQLFYLTLKVIKEFFNANCYLLFYNIGVHIVNFASMVLVVLES